MRVRLAGGRKSLGITEFAGCGSRVKVRETGNIAVSRRARGYEPQAALLARGRQPFTRELCLGRM